MLVERENLLLDGNWLLGAVGAVDLSYDRPLFLDAEVPQVKNLADLEHVAFFGGAPLGPFQHLFF